MADPTPVILPSFVNSILTSAARKGLTSVAAALAVHGYALSDTQTQAFTEQGIAAAIFLASVGWSYFQVWLNKRRLQVAVSPGVVDAANPPTGAIKNEAVHLDTLVNAS